MAVRWHLGTCSTTTPVSAQSSLMSHNWNLACRLYIKQPPESSLNHLATIHRKNCLRFSTVTYHSIHTNMRRLWCHWWKFRCNYFLFALLGDFVNKLSPNTWKHHHLVLDCCHSILCACCKSFENKVVSSHVKIVETSAIYAVSLLHTGPCIEMFLYLHWIIVWIAGYDGTTMQIGWKNKWIRGDESHQRNRFRLIRLQSLNQWTFEAIREISIQVNVGSISAPNISCLRLTLSFLRSTKLKTDK